MAIRWNTAKRNALATTGVQSLTVLEIRTGTQPASANTAASGTLLATVTVSWGSATTGVVNITGTPSATASASGTAGWGRFRDSGDTLRMDGAVGAEFTLADTNIVSGGTVTVTSGSLTQPSGE
jgi:hypothetical protein